MQVLPGHLSCYAVLPGLCLLVQDLNRYFDDGQKWGIELKTLVHCHGMNPCTHYLFNW